MAEIPKLSIGMPVYNGERYLPAAIAGLLGQSFSDFEMIIQDNASTDRTEDICRSFAATDQRIQYQKNAQNLGAAANYNLCLEQAQGEYFKWAAHDDVCKPAYLQSCIDVLDHDPQVVLCHSISDAIDSRGRRIGVYEIEPSAMDESSWKRFASMILPPHYCIPVFGVMRRTILEQTIRHGDWVGADRNLLAELALHGKVQLVPEALFQRRHHAGSSISRFPDERQRASWFRDQQGFGRVYPTWRRLREYLAAINRVPLGFSERLACRLTLLRWISGRHHTGSFNLQMMIRELGPTPAAD